MRKNSSNWLAIRDPYTGQIHDIPPGHAARLAGVNRTTALRWCKNGIPDAVHDRLAALVHGVLPDPAWHRFRCRGGHLVNVETGDRFAPVDLERVYLVHQQLAELRRRPTERVLRLVGG